MILLAINGYTSYNKIVNLTVELCNPTATLRWQPWGSFTVSDGLEVARAHSIVDPTGYNSTDYYYYQGGQPAHGVSNVRRKDCRLGTTYLRTT